ncbi:glycoside hydrolase family 9 protein [Bacteroidales bacterium]|nr:glycoside hydrolase family 9 protein [Bacteroidales bacterium]
MKTAISIPHKQLTSRLLLLLSLVLISSILSAQIESRHIIIDQFGYLPGQSKIAVIRNPQVGFYSERTFVPGNTYAVVDANSGEQIYTGSPTAWNSGATDESSGDQVWHFYFSSVDTIGAFYVLDVENNTRSFEFNINPAIYNEVLKQAVRTFFYQRVGHNKDAEYAGTEWADSACHIGPLQDKNCRIFNDPTNAATEKDVSGGWYDAGDFNKYTNWTANYIVSMMLAYLENPAAWSDDYNIPESENGIPDLLDEAKWGTDHLLRLQWPDGSLISVVGEDGASPPSLAAGQSLYGSVNTSSTLTSAGAYALSSTVFRMIGMEEYADSLLASAQRAWDWADANPSVIFRNNDDAYGSKGLAAGQQETDDYGRAMKKLQAAAYLYEATDSVKYRTYFDNYYRDAHMFAWTYVYPYENTTQDVLLYYTTLPGATTSVINDIKNIYVRSMNNSSDNFPAYNNTKDPYLAHMGSYTWGSNSTKGKQGGMFYNMVEYGLDASKNEDAMDASLGFIHYLHGVNPLNMVYLSNMYRYGAEYGVREFYHTWFNYASERWDRVGESTYGPAPGYVTGGANPSYNWDGCCSGTCGTGNNEKCFDVDVSEVMNQPTQKSYLDFNNSWPLNSWELTENSCGYQLSYIRLLSKFVDTSYDCNGDLNGTAFIDACGTCAGGNTGIVPVTDPAACGTPMLTSFSNVTSCETYTSPSGKSWDSSGIYLDTVTTKAGWQEKIVIDLIVGSPTFDTLNIDTCDAYLSPSGLYTWSESGEYVDTILNHKGCDSIITFNLTVREGFDTTIVIVACDSFQIPGTTQYLTESGIYSETNLNAVGCDSIITYDITIHKLKPSVIMLGDILYASPQSQEYFYQWVDCDKDFQLVEGATDPQYLPTASGNYAVVVNHHTYCADTSDCYSVSITGIKGYINKEGYRIYPNPFSEGFQVVMPGVTNHLDIEIRNIAGKVVYGQKLSGIKEFIISPEIPAGLYFMTLRNHEGNVNSFKIIRE